MKYSILIAVLALWCSHATAAETDFPGLEGIPEIVAEVNDKPIKRFELIRELAGSSGKRPKTHGATLVGAALPVLILNGKTRALRS